MARTAGGLEELDDKIKSAGGSATLVPVDMKDADGIARLALALNERYGKLDIMVGNAGVLGPLSPLDHVERKDFETNMAVNVTANWWLIRTMDALLKRSDAGRAVFVTSGLGWLGRAYVGPYAAAKAALNMLVQTYAAESDSTAVKVNAFNPGPTRTRMYAGGWPGVDPNTLTPPEDVAKAIVPLCLPVMQRERQGVGLSRGQVPVVPRAGIRRRHAPSDIFTSPRSASAPAPPAPCRTHNPRRRW